MILMLPAVFLFLLRSKRESTASERMNSCYIAFVLNIYKSKETNCIRDDSNQFPFTSQSSLNVEFLFDILHSFNSTIVVDVAVAPRHKTNASANEDK